MLTNITKSVLNFVPTTEDDGKSITCRAENPKIPGQSALETSWKIEVICKFTETPQPGTQDTKVESLLTEF